MRRPGGALGKPGRRQRPKEVISAAILSRLGLKPFKFGSRVTHRMAWKCPLNYSVLTRQEKVKEHVLLLMLTASAMA
ncbi:MAG: hypothetical protein JWM11_3215 [Planctomycetaceae bacterium]|nr:hypothetical protein [Planctomycetaceae bacterium]